MKDKSNLIEKPKEKYGAEQEGACWVNLTWAFEAKPDGLAPESWLFNTPEGIRSLAAARGLYAAFVSIVLVMDDGVWSVPEIAENYAQHLRFSEADFVVKEAEYHGVPVLDLHDIRIEPLDYLAGNKLEWVGFDGQRDQYHDPDRGEMAYVYPDHLVVGRCTA